MKIIHCADLHLDSKMESNLTKDQAIQRREELVQTFVNMVNFAKVNEVKVIIIAGDMFDTSQNNQVRIKRRVLEQIKSAEEIDFIYLRGNHDKVDFFEKLEEKPDNLKMFHDSWTSFTYGDIVINGCELSKNSGNSIYSELSLKQDRINIVVLHGQESNYDKKDDAEVINLSLLKNRNIDYLALGHIHTYKYAKLDNRGSYCYCGCLEGRGFDECGEKGFVLLDVDDKKVDHSFIPIAKRKLNEVNVVLSGIMSESQIQEAVEDKLSGISKIDFVKIIFTGEIDEETDIDIKYLLSIFSSRFYFLKIYNQTKLMLCYEDYAKDISLKGEFIRLVQEQNLDEDEKNSIILTGLKALAGREIDI